ncbi:response regulator [Myxococcus llanfairpwllgwyngyllgogerychwyrndrobwllllantysiliogogogochensis]|uniref:histidine kinase n=1 Tax=Myxococcus llanfairpwllgwyngyllgogerychwyrndrobwllllantysiliogogogochensis TaxID=2590453 RepID=A0A540WQC9_9BACT|nr:response regulator [Myxococcus llanfairpwllgwyngyllgogerychwyrndrobwllllantysiliogogogochensis]TQF11220.1 response regulator [Myxococcus llanfairpwllgwyngyllgogerychwyrndrobwllllantysiliogogogochensis]
MTPSPTEVKTGRASRFGPPLPPGTFAGFIVAALAIFIIAILSYRSLESHSGAAELVRHTMEVSERMKTLLSTLKDAETGQRGFLLTGERTYLEPYTSASRAIPGQLERIRQLVSDNDSQLQRLEALKPLVEAKIAELQTTIDLKTAGQSEAALTRVRTNEGIELMNRVRLLVEQMENEERQLLAERSGAFQSSATTSLIVTWLGSALLLVLVGVSAFMTSRDYRARSIHAWMQEGQTLLATRMQGGPRLDQLGDQVLQFLAQYLDAQVGAIYLADSLESFQRFAGYALPPSFLDPSAQARPGNGLVGQAIKENRVFHLRDVPEGYLPINSSLGQGKPRHLLVVPTHVDGRVNAVLELGFLHPVHPSDLELLQRVSESVGMAVRSANDRTRLEQLLEETRRQSEELQAQQEELRASNEEIEEQSRVLRDSQSRLEQQQAELEQTNAQLETQTNLLERQRDTLTVAQAELTEKATELERTSRYKSEFLANMSHELRTPLNSSLILAKLLADNKTGNLTEEQVKFAQTITSAGNDLLALINDILDLSRIEAGKVELEPEVVSLPRFVENISRSFHVLAREKQIGFSTRVDPGSAESLETDPQRLGQVLKNLLANALKFTEKGEVSLHVSPVGPGHLAFAVRDTGIGIPAHLQGLIFEAFRQADGSTHRKYGGSGLGLSISRDLARLLGGDVSVESEPGKGSTFTLTVPVALAASASGPLPLAPTPSERAAQLPAPVLADVQMKSLPAPIEDDRERLVPGARLILVVEDDPHFAEILRDLSRELGFLCVATDRGGTAYEVAVAYQPSAILLDMNLPDQSGLMVLDQLKRDPRTRHIPVHVISVTDASREALERGAVGYALKPVKREQLMEAVRKLETRLTPGVQRVLVVEDDARQRESIEKLLESEDVRIDGVATAAEALELLKVNTFGCMVMDLNLPDLSGYELLEQMAELETVSFPPVIVYTGRSLTREEEQRLRRYSKSIIIKGARSPERLVDEVTLFLHQVESKLPLERQRMLQVARDREATLDGRRILVVEDDVRNIFALSSVLEPRGVKVEIARNGREALDRLANSLAQASQGVDLVLMDIMMPEMDGLTAMREIRKRTEWQKLPIIALTAKAMRDDQEKCLAAGANDYIAKPLDVEKLLSLIRVWMPNA